MVRIARTALWLILIACTKEVRPTEVRASDAAIDSSGVASLPSGPSGVESASRAPSMTALDPHALESACLEKERVYCRAQERYTRGSVDAGSELELCARRNALACVSEASQVGSGLTAATLAECARSEEELATRSIWGQTGQYCSVKGQLAHGRPCAYDSQCASGHCLAPRGAWCGNCGDELPFAAGMACVVDRCGVGLACVSGRCVVPKPLDSSCSGGDVCNGEGSCVGNTCVRRAKKGERCSIEEKGAPWCGPGLDCDEHSKTCQIRKGARAPKKIAEPCGDGDSCVHGYCKRREGQKGLCVPYSPDGMGCDPSEDTCQSPARCRDGSCLIGRPLCPKE